MSISRRALIRVAIGIAAVTAMGLAHAVGSTRAVAGPAPSGPGIVSSHQRDSSNSYRLNPPQNQTRFRIECRTQRYLRLRTPPAVRAA
jgi:hypothetical protein